MIWGCVKYFFKININTNNRIYIYVTENIYNYSKIFEMKWLR